MTNILKTLLRFCSLFSVLFPISVFAVPFSHCEPSVSVNGMLDYWHVEKGADTMAPLSKKVTNNSCKASSYYLVKVARVTDPLTQPKEHILNPKEMSQSVLAYPATLAIGPQRTGETKLVLPKGQSETLQFYRLIFNPVLPEKKYGFNVDKKELNKIKSETRMALAISTNVVVEPRHPDYTYSIERKKNTNQIQIDYRGNALLQVSVYGQCQAEKSSSKSNKNITVIPCSGKSSSFSSRIYTADVDKKNKGVKVFDLSQFKGKVNVHIKKGAKSDNHTFNISEQK
ncbi:hypothetical protein M9194_07745 [Vibrio sp. S4M6]|uniref:hypothetical protein n=1 Tax=Vibrio sinus TaxID=2946865 RepID=UPI00202AA725|nr:hypothetical protein [Vibrio sinus]MCL9781318.1 hypothetical protein [Vibrio sinus]